MSDKTKLKISVPECEVALAVATEYPVIGEELATLILKAKVEEISNFNDGESMKGIKPRNFNQIANIIEKQL